jgi:hypothetical protein
MKAMATLKANRFRGWLMAAIIVVIIPLMVWSFPSNPPLGKTGAPGEGTCGDCHGGGPGGGKIAVTSSIGAFYKPGVEQRLTVTITDPNATKWGYEMTAVKTSNPSVGKGVFKVVDTNSSVRSSGTKSYAAQVNDKSGKTLQVKYPIDWIPPSKNVGKVTLYFAANASDSTYNSSLTLSPQ